MIEDKDLERLREIFITRKECSENTNSVENKISKDLVRIAIIETRINQITWLLTAVVSGVIATLIKLFFGM